MAMSRGLYDLPLSVGGYHFDYIFTHQGVRLLATDGWKRFDRDYGEMLPDVRAFVRDAVADIKNQWKRGALPQPPSKQPGGL